MNEVRLTEEIGAIFDRWFWKKGGKSVKGLSSEFLDAVHSWGNEPCPHEQGRWPLIHKRECSLCWESLEAGK